MPASEVTARQIPIWRTIGNHFHIINCCQIKKPGNREGSPVQLVKKVFFDKLCAVLQNLKSSEKPVIANERHP
jgi:hypothetical protein